MSLMMFYQWPDAALVITDTLACTLEREPSMYSSKVLPLPHLNLATMGTGSQFMFSLWGDFLNRVVVDARDIDAVNEIAPKELRRLWGVAEEEIGPGQRSRICCLGFPAGSDKIVRYTYDSVDDFEPKFFDGESLWMQPVPRTFTIETMPQSREDYIDLATRIREEYRKGVAADPVPIGGDLHATVIENWSIHTSRWHRFSDYEETRQAMPRTTTLENEETEGAPDEHR